MVFGRKLYGLLNIGSTEEFYDVTYTVAQQKLHGPNESKRRKVHGPEAES